MTQLNTPTTNHNIDTPTTNHNIDTPTTNHNISEKTQEFQMLVAVYHKGDHVEYCHTLK